jgi:hypothetical protein
MAHDCNTARAEWQTLRDELKAIDVEIASKDANDSDLPRLRQARTEAARVDGRHEGAPRRR